MKISVKKAAPDVYALSLDDTELALDGADIKTLLLEITRILAPAEEVARTAKDRVRDFLRHIKNANDVGLQKFLLVADHDDVLVLLKAAEDDKALSRKFYSNMSERSRKIFIEDLAYKFRQEVSGSQIAAAISRLIGVAKELEDEGTLVYENVIKR
jgi:flagellar motor switch protein FliG